MTLAAALALLGAAAGAEPLLTVDAITDRLEADRAIGARRSGMLCTPAGKVRWRDAAPRSEGTRLVLATALAERGAAVTIPSRDDFDGRVHTRYRIDLEIVDVRLDTCVPWRGIRVGGQARLKATGQVAAIWRVFDQKQHRLVAKVPVCLPVNVRDAEALPIVLAHALADKGLDTLVAQVAPAGLEAASAAAEASVEVAGGCALSKR